MLKKLKKLVSVRNLVVALIFMAVASFFQYGKGIDTAAKIPVPESDHPCYVEGFGVMGKVVSMSKCQQGFPGTFLYEGECWACY